jgi:hypothetical protein
VSALDLSDTRNAGITYSSSSGIATNPLQALVKASHPPFITEIMFLCSQAGEIDFVLDKKRTRKAAIGSVKAMTVTTPSLGL